MGTDLKAFLVACESLRYPTDANKTPDTDKAANWQMQSSQLEQMWKYWEKNGNKPPYDPQKVILWHKIISESIVAVPESLAKKADEGKALSVNKLFENLEKNADALGIDKSKIPQLKKNMLGYSFYENKEGADRFIAAKDVVDGAIYNGVTGYIRDTLIEKNENSRVELQAATVLAYETQKLPNQASLLLRHYAPQTLAYAGFFKADPDLKAKLTGTPTTEISKVTPNPPSTESKGDKPADEKSENDGGKPEGDKKPASDNNLNSFNAAATGQKYIGKNAAKYCNKGPEVRQLHDELIIAGILSNEFKETDEYKNQEFGDETHNKIVALQTDSQIKIDGLVGPATLSIINKKQLEIAQKAYDADKSEQNAQLVAKETFETSEMFQLAAQQKFKGFGANSTAVIGGFTSLFNNAQTNTQINGLMAADQNRFTGFQATINSLPKLG